VRDLAEARERLVGDEQMLRGLELATSVWKKLRKQAGISSSHH